MTIRCDVSIPDSHPSLAGHFPGNPVVPGVVILDAVRQCLQQQIDTVVKGVSHTKFIDILLPGQLMTVLLEPGEGKAGFRCQRGEQVIAQGEFRIGIRHQP